MILVLFLALAFSAGTFAQDVPASPDTARLAAAQAAFDQEKWEQAAELASGPADQNAELDYLKGLALAKLQRWNDSRAAFAIGYRKAPHDARFLVELAGVSYKQNNFAEAKRELRAALRLDPKNAYAHEFLGTIYFLEGNLEAALKYWNAIDKPRLRKVSVEPPPRLNEKLLDGAVGFNPPQVLTSDAWLNAEARLANLGIYPHQRTELVPAGEGNYDATLHLTERDGIGDSTWEGLLSWLSGLPYETVYPSYYDFGHRAVNASSLLRWDAQKRQAYVELSGSVLGDAALRVKVYFDARNENWNLSNTFFGAGAPLSDLNVRRVAAGAELHEVMDGRWSWTVGTEVAHRSFRNVEGPISSGEQPFFVNGTSAAAWFKAERLLLRVPERRLTVDSTGEARLGREFAGNVGSFATLRGGLDARWLPRARGDDYEVRAQFRVGDTFGQVPFDELFQLGIERDNDLWLRGHAGTTDGRKGAAPLGRRYMLTNWEMDKNVYGNGFFTVKLGPFLDNGAIADASGLFGSQRWLWDAGAQCKVRVLGSVTVVLSYGRDLRGGRNVFYATALH